MSEPEGLQQPAVVIDREQAIVHLGEVIGCAFMLKNSALFHGEGAEQLERMENLIRAATAAATALGVPLWGEGEE